ncbi:hypothetical protein POM88_043641 [Heracleum sosnowskyi]|uniref:Centromere/kinetochore protein zw10 middle domain-containing protein n=1 Tax=Heracleum sosnowskyi TaxID=360622 RepID=A0AAD8H1E0_9APIA|nr:hypothetical protein POM88_043641 [Heracleum sosnowskyi]
MQEILAKFMENDVSFDQQSNALRVKYWSSINGNNSVKLHTVLTAMDVVGVMDFGLAKVVDLIIKYVITQAVNPESHISFSEEMIQDSGRKTEVVLKMVPSFEPKLKGIDGQAIFTDERLSDFAENVEVHFASRKKVEILAKARSLLLQSNFVLPNGVTRDAKNAVPSQLYKCSYAFFSSSHHLALVASDQVSWPLVQISLSKDTRKKVFLP